MSNKYIVALLTVATVLGIRSFVFLFPLRRLVVGGVLIHHFWIGLILLLAGSLVPKRRINIRLITLSVGLGLLFDELGFMLFGPRTLESYWSAYSVAGVVIMLMLVFVLSGKLTKKLL